MFSTVEREGHFYEKADSSAKWISSGLADESCAMSVEKAVRAK